MTQEQRQARRVDRARPKRAAPSVAQTTRPARQVHRGPYLRGTVVKMIPGDGATHEYLTVKAPDGLILLVPPEHGAYPLWLAQAGEWVYRWGDGEEQRIVVEEGQPETAESSVADLPAMRVHRRPRF